MSIREDRVISKRLNDFKIVDYRKEKIYSLLDIQRQYGLDIWCVQEPPNQFRFGRKEIGAENGHVVAWINLKNHRFVINRAHQNSQLMTAMRERFHQGHQSNEFPITFGPRGTLRIETADNAVIFDAIKDAIIPIYRRYISSDSIFYGRENSRCNLPADYEQSHSGLVYEDISKIICRHDIDDTEKECLIKARLGQGEFRAALDRVWNGQCALTGCSIREVLRASHIKPWADSNDQERLDANNGLLLSASADAFFDSGLISFSDTGKTIYASIQDVNEMRRHGVLNQLNKELNNNQIEYLRWHRENVFRGQRDNK
jgi:HNH endonuclease